ncbi:MAG: cytochrome c3 family protein [Nitrospira sp.]|nr:cytochrome c3 family protein [Nitrospira sp.]
MKKLLIYGFVGLMTFLAGYIINITFFSDRSPAQPIAFSHRVHAHENEIPCMYCHAYADKSAVAGIPAVQRCIGCHSIIKRDAPEIVKLTGYWDRKEPIPWIKVHNLPDFVYFTHKRHVRAGIQCNICHGDVAGMDVITRVASLKMGWCLECHRKRGVKAGADCWTCHK